MDKSEGVRIAINFNRPSSEDGAALELLYVVDRHSVQVRTDSPVESGTVWIVVSLFLVGCEPIDNLPGVQFFDGASFFFGHFPKQIQGRDGKPSQELFVHVQCSHLHDPGLLDRQVRVFGSYPRHFETSGTCPRRPRASEAETRRIRSG